MKFINTEGYFRLRDDIGIEPVTWYNYDINQVDLHSDVTSWLVSFKSANSLNLLKKAISDNLLDRIINSDVYLTLYNQIESHHDVVYAIYQHAVINLGIPEEKIILITASPDIAAEVTLVANQLVKKEFKCKFFTWAEPQVQTDKKHLISQGNNIQTLEDKQYDKKFLNFNRLWRPHRLILISILYSTGCLDNGYVSLARDKEDRFWSNGGWSSKWDQMMKYANDEIRDMLNLNKEFICNLPDMYLDNENFYNVYGIRLGAALYPKTDYLYTTSYFSLISETNFYDDHPARHLTEKTFKPIAQQHPFILVSRPKSLEFLRSLGYKTFSPYINESYDNELDNNKRLLMIAKETARLSNLNAAELTNFLNGVRDICKYNQDILMNKTDFVFDLN